VSFPWSFITAFYEGWREFFEGVTLWRSEEKFVERMKAAKPKGKDARGKATKLSRLMIFVVFLYYITTGNTEAQVRTLAALE